MTSFFGELRRRNVVKVAVAYAIVGWILVEVSATVLPIFEAPDWITQVFTFFVILGFPLALILSWAYELTPQGVVRADEVPLSESITHVTGQKLNYFVTGLVVLALGFVIVDQYVLEEREVVVEEATESPPPVLEDTQRDVLPNSVAVLLFENLSLDPEDAFFAAGIHDTILNELAKIQDLNVMSRTAMLRYADGQTPIAQIAEELNVQSVMEGSVQYADGRVRITAQLIDPTTGAHLWSDLYDRDFADIFVIQSEIATQIAMALEAELLPAERESIERGFTDNAEAYVAYLRSLSLGLRGSSIHEYLDQAIALDPNFARAYAGKAIQYAGDILGNAEELPQLERLSREYAEQALALDPTLGVGHIALGMVDRFRWRGVEALAAFERALQLSPNDPYVLYTYSRFNWELGRNPEAIRTALRAVELDPNNAELHLNLGDSYFFTANPDTATVDAAEAAYSRVTELEPSEPLSQLQLGLLEVIRGNDAGALARFGVAEQLGPFDTRVLARTAYGYGQIGRRADAERLLAALQARTRVGPAQLGLAYLGVGDPERALAQFNTAIDSQDTPAAGYTITAQMKANVLSDPILERPEFIDLRQRLGYTDL